MSNEQTKAAFKVLNDRYDAVCSDLRKLRDAQRKVDAQIEDVQRTKYALERAIETLLPGIEEDTDPVPDPDEVLEQKELAESFRREMDAA